MAAAPPRKGPRRSRLTGKQKALIVVAVLLAIALAGVLLWRSLFVKPEVNSEQGNGQGLTEELDYGDGVQPRTSGARKNDEWYTILVLGRDTGGGGNCDTMMLASYNVKDQKMTVLNIPRDTMVNVPWDVKKINSVYNMNGKGDKGIQALYQEISQLVGFQPDFKVIVEWEAVGKLVDAIGGVWFDVPRTMDYEDPFQDLTIHIQKGYQKLNGQQAMGVVRFRDGKNGYQNGDIGRIETQQNFLKAVMEQLLQIQNVTKIKELARVFQETVETDLSYQNLFWLGKSAVLGGLKMENVNFVTMPHKGVSAWSRSYGQNLSYVVPKAEELLELVNNELSPFEETFTLSDLDIMSVNSNGTISSSTGHVEDRKAAAPPAKPAKQPEKPKVPEGRPEDPASPPSPPPEDPGGGTTTPVDPPVTSPTEPATPPEEPVVPPVTPPVEPPDPPVTPSTEPVIPPSPPPGPDISVIEPGPPL